MKKTKRSVIYKIKKDLSKLAPSAKSVDIKVEKVDKNDYESLIRVYIPPQKNLIAYKKASNLSKSLERCKNEIIKQIKKIDYKNHHLG